MKQRITARLFGLVLAAVFLATSAIAGERATPREARALFDQAVKFLDANGPEKSWPNFNNPRGPFVKKDLYIYVIDRQGTYIANGASAETLVGLKVLDSVDATGKPLFREMIAVTEKQDEAHINYMWLNRKTNHVEPKFAWLHRSGDFILGVGYYAPRSNASDAKKMLDQAAIVIKKQGLPAALARFNDTQGPFIRDDLYVFAINIDSGNYEAHGMNPKWVGKNASELIDVEGHEMVKEMIKLVKAKGQGTVDYVWRNPVTNAVEKKRSFVRRDGKTMFGVGYYTE
jgi:cytochrome c